MSACPTQQPTFTISVVNIITNGWFSLNDSDPCCCLTPHCPLPGGTGSSRAILGYTGLSTLLTPQLLAPGSWDLGTEQIRAYTSHNRQSQLKNWMKFYCIFESLSHYTMSVHQLKKPLNIHLNINQRQKFITDIRYSQFIWTVFYIFRLRRVFNHHSSGPLRLFELYSILQF